MNPSFCLLAKVGDTFLRGASFGGSRITISQTFCLDAASFMNSVASFLMNEIFSGLNLFRRTFSSASSKAGDEESIPERS